MYEALDSVPVIEKIWRKGWREGRKKVGRKKKSHSSQKPGHDPGSTTCLYKKEIEGDTETEV